MFDQVVTRPRVRLVKSVMVVGSAVAHAVVVAGLMVAAMWHVERVPIGAFSAEITMPSNKLPQGAAELPGGKPQTVLRPRVVKVKALTQPTVTPPEVIPTGPTSGPEVGPPGGSTDGPHCRLATDPQSELPLCPADVPPCAEPPCALDGEKPTPGTKKPLIDTKVEVPIVSPSVAKGLRLSGDEQIFPPRLTQLAMVHDGKTTVRGTFQLCVDEGGSISSVRRLASTGFEGYDAALMDAMRGWRYRPYQLESPPKSGNFTPAPMCTVQVFVYRIED